MADEPKSIGDILDRIEDLAGNKDEVALGDVVEALGNRGHGPFLLVPALLEISPIGGIPGLPTVLAAIIILFAVQMLIGRQHLWLPDFLMRRSLSSRKACKATSKLRGFARFMDRWFHGRLPKLTQGPFVRIAALLCICLALTVPPLELLPFASTAPMAAIAAFGLALLVRDGLLMIIAALLALVAVGVGLGFAVEGDGGNRAGSRSFSAGVHARHRLHRHPIVAVVDCLIGLGEVTEAGRRSMSPTTTCRHSRDA